MADRDYLNLWYPSPLSGVSGALKPGQNPVAADALARSRWAVCLGRLRLPFLPLTREQAPTNREYLGEREPPLQTQRYREAPAKVKIQRYAEIDRSQVAFKVTHVRAGMVEGGWQEIIGVVESCGMRPNLRSILNEAHPTHLCFMPRMLVKTSDTVIGAYAIQKLVTFDLVPYDPSLV